MDERWSSIDHRRTADSTRAFRAMAKKLFTVCHSLNENPYVRYAQKSDLCVSFASLLQDQLDQIAERDENEEVLFVVRRRRHSTLLISAASRR